MKEFTYAVEHEGIHLWRIPADLILAWICAGTRNFQRQIQHMLGFSNRNSAKIGPDQTHRDEQMGYCRYYGPQKENSICTPKILGPAVVLGCNMECQYIPLCTTSLAAACLPFCVSLSRIHSLCLFPSPSLPHFFIPSSFLHPYILLPFCFLSSFPF